MTQPLLDLFGKNPEFFVAGNYSRAQIVLFALLIALVPPLVGIGLTAAAIFFDRRVGTVVFAAVIAVLAWALVLAMLRTLEVDSAVLVFTLTLLAGLAVAVLVVRTRGAQLFASYLAVANLLFVGSFIFFSRTAELVTSDSGGDVGAVEVPELRGSGRRGRARRAPGGVDHAQRRFDQRCALPGLRRAGGGEHVVPQHVQPRQPHQSRDPGDPHGARPRRRRPADLPRSSAQPVHPPRRANYRCGGTSR